MPLTEEQKTIVQATVPILETGGETLTKHFYGIMLTEYPEVVPFFNKTHQKSGDQPRALAHAVLMYAKHIDRLENLGNLASQIVQKHVSLAVQADHYPIVGTCLLRAIREVLGPEVATEAVLDAWAAAYGQLAELLITAEEAIYVAQAKKEGGWRNGRKFRLLNKVIESPDSTIISFYFAPSDQGALISYVPGQFTCIQAMIDGQSIRRNYSLSQVSNGQTFRITVKRETHGVMSTYLHDQVHVGDEVELLPPAGDFVYVEPTIVDAATSPVIFIAGGIGITPLVPLLAQVLTTTIRPVTFIHCCPSRASQAFADDLTQWTKEYPQSRLTVHHWYTQETSSSHRWTIDELRGMFPTESHQMICSDVYFVGPKGFMVDVKRMCHEDFGIPLLQLHYEFFGPAAQI